MTHEWKIPYLSCIQLATAAPFNRSIDLARDYQRAIFLPYWCTSERKAIGFTPDTYLTKLLLLLLLPLTT